MRLVTFQSASSRAGRLGALLGDDQALDLTAAGAAPAFASMLALIEAGSAGSAGSDRARALTAMAPAQHRSSLAEVRLLAPIPLPPQIPNRVLAPSREER